MKALPDYDYEIVLVDNASTDSSASIYQALVTSDARVNVICMSRNFGNSQPSYLAGLRYATGDAVVMFDGDLQDPPELIPDMVKKWEEGFDVVYCTRVKRSESIMRKIGYRCFYRLFKFLSYLDIPLNSGDNSLLDRKVIDVITALPEKDIYLRGLRTWAGFKQTGIDYMRDPRVGGKTSNSFFANFYWAKKAIVNFSYKPLEYISRIAACAVIATMFAASLYLYWHFAYGAPHGFSTLLMVMLIFNSIQLLALAVIGEYLIRIFQEVKGRPPYVIREVMKQNVVLTKDTKCNSHQSL